MSSNRVYHLVIRVPKKESAYMYFQMEANEGLCFYSTLPESMGTPYRDIDIKTDMTLKDEVVRLLEVLKKQVDFETILEEELD